jgi:ribosome-associated protein
MLENKRMMKSNKILNRSILKECTYSAVRASGPGGQNVNKVNTKVELRFKITDSMILNDEEKQAILRKLSSRITSSGELVISSQAERSQLKNKKAVTEKFIDLLEKAIQPAKKRIPTAPTFSAIEKRIEEKKKLGKQKKLRIPPSDEM